MEIRVWAPSCDRGRERRLRSRPATKIPRLNRRGREKLARRGMLLLRTRQSRDPATAACRQSKLQLPFNSKCVPTFWFHAWNEPRLFGPKYDGILQDECPKSPVLDYPSPFRALAPVTSNFASPRHSEKSATSPISATRWNIIGIWEKSPIYAARSQGFCRPGRDHINSRTSWTRRTAPFGGSECFI